ncbi:FAD-dependent monooxygenase [Amycolatopsis sp. FDAARGOS 1241]|uniref:FAD-dependent monooxygenase n=1 Tax=Amycolatopsis sp. FDAARGOS 1241 TaxID=2778070 RepID=UPI0019502AA0|nr:FAD-dependent monooxygenase [Amycolatopsis sp. FDAARGOS 1241]QRP44906.1 FAD-dependent monooxygenase [Amycolatopsis sp. FDAARGOS 1241]
MEQRHVVVIGGGIGGLSAAVGLHRTGWQVTVYERASEFTGIGAGISIWPNAQRALAELGVEAPLAPQRDGALLDPRGRELARWAMDPYVRRYGLPLTAIHRADLIDALRAALPESSLHTGVDVLSASSDGLVRHATGTIRADLVVAADGVHSPVRASLHPQARLAYSRGTAFRGVAELPGTRLSTTWGRGTEVGVLPLHDGRAYWWVAEARPEGIRHDDVRAYLLDRYGDWHAPVPTLICATPEILHHDLYQLAARLPSYVSGRLVLLGDAAHAMPPYLGQGGCMALEDAVVLAAALSSTDDVTEGLRRYDAERRPRSQRVWHASIRAGSAGPLLRNPLGRALRTAVLRLAPASAMSHAESWINGWTPPRLPRPARPRTP